MNSSGPIGDRNDAVAAGETLVAVAKRWLLAALTCSFAVANALGAEPSDGASKPRPRVAAIVTVYHHNSHADMIVGRLLQGYTLDGQGERPRMQLASLYVDQFPAKDTSRELARRHGFRLSATIADALTLGTEKLAVDGVLLIAEHGDYPESATGSILFPKRRFFNEVVSVFEASGRSVPVFFDKHLADNWPDAKAIYDTARRRDIPLLAGSTLPITWRLPPADVTRGTKLRDSVVVSHHRLDSYGFHALEVAQCLAERRAGGETGIAAVRCLEGPEVWKAAERGEFDRRLVDAALLRLKERPLPVGKKIEDLVPQPQLFLIEYRDGLRVAVITLNYVVVEWAAAWRSTDGDRIDSTLFWTHELRPFGHFSFLVREIDNFMATRRAPWPVERTLLTTGLLDALLMSRRDSGRRRETPHLDIRYEAAQDWKVPPPPPPGRPIEGP